MSKRQKVRSIFISDIHLGCNYSRADVVVDFLKRYKADYIYLVGDIVDGWKFKRRPYWSLEFTLVIKSVISLMKRGARVYYITGNHDEFLREYTNLEIENVCIEDEVIHTTADGRKILVIHGDIFDHVTRYFRWLSLFGSVAYDIALTTNKYLNMLRRKMGFKYWSLSKLLKTHVKNAVNYIGDFEKCIERYTVRKGCEAVICGHLHIPETNKKLGRVTYYNCGDFVDNCTGIIEHEDGTLELVHYFST